MIGLNSSTAGSGGAAGIIAVIVVVVAADDDENDEDENDDEECDWLTDTPPPLRHSASVRLTSSSLRSSANGVIDMDRSPMVGLPAERGVRKEKTGKERWAGDGAEEEEADDDNDDEDK